MSGPYTVTLLQLQPDVTGHASTDTKHELGRMGLEEIMALAAKLQQLPPSTQTGAAPGIIVRRGDKAWRISAHQGRLRVHHGTSALDDYWTAETVAHLAELPPFRHAGTTSSHSMSPRDGVKTRSTSRTVLEVVGLLIVGLVLVYVAAHFGTPRRKLSTPPANFDAVSNPEERSTIFRRLAGTYATDKKPGNSVVIITPDGQFIYSTIGKDGKPIMPPNMQGQATAGLLAEAPAVVTGSGPITQVDENTVLFRRFRFTRLAVN